MKEDPECIPGNMCLITQDPESVPSNILSFDRLPRCGSLITNHSHAVSALDWSWRMIPQKHMAVLLEDDDTPCHEEEIVTEQSLLNAFPKMKPDQETPKHTHI